MNSADNSSNFAMDDRIHLGEGLFETIKVQQGQPSFPELHWQRLNNAARCLYIHFSLSKTEWFDLLISTIQKDQVVNGGIKAILSGGVAPRGLITQSQESKLVLQGFTFTPQKKALRLLQASWLRDANNPIYQFKTVNYLEAILARREAINNGADDALFFNTKHHVTETTCANIFLINNGRLITPPQQDGVLPGITRGRILTECKRLGIECQDTSINREHLEQAEAVFLTNALQGIHYVKSFDGISFTLNHPVAERLVQALEETVAPKR